MAPMTNAERQKKYRQKLKENNPEKHNEKRIAHLEKVKENQRKISELTDSEKEQRRRKWRQYSSKYYEKQKNNNNDEDKTKGDNVLVRYYMKKSWRYYIGTIEDIHEDSMKVEKLYNISFYKTLNSIHKLKFRKLLREDKDTAPENSVVKLVQLLQISEKPEEYVLYHDEDLIYFKIEIIIKLQQQ